MSDLIVADTSPLIFLHGIDRLNLLPAMFRTVLIPEAVAREVATGIHLGKPGPDLASYPWATLRTCLDDPRITGHRLGQHLGAGERAALSLALTIDGSAVLIDERDARTVAHDMHLGCVGTLGLLVKAKRMHHLSAVAPELTRLEAAHFRIAPALRRMVLEAVGEMT